jgi:hypothetical protein
MKFLICDLRFLIAADGMRRRELHEFARMKRVGEKNQIIGSGKICRVRTRNPSLAVG